MQKLSSDYNMFLAERKHTNTNIKKRKQNKQIKEHTNKQTQETNNKSTNHNKQNKNK